MNIDTGDTLGVTVRVCPVCKGPINHDDDPEVVRDKQGRVVNVIHRVCFDDAIEGIKSFILDTTKGGE